MPLGNVTLSIPPSFGWLDGNRTLQGIEGTAIVPQALAKLKGRKFSTTLRIHPVSECVSTPTLTVGVRLQHGLQQLAGAGELCQSHCDTGRHGG